MRRALGAARHPQVEFMFREVSGTLTHDLDTGLYHAGISGDLSMAGRTRRIEVKASVRRLSRTRFQVRAELPLRMTDFGIVPPTALFGAIRARDDLTVSFDLRLEVVP